jgi:DNA-binding FrmR family transcriptional regulator
MTIYLDDLITEKFATLVDDIAKDAICQIPSYRQAPLELTIERVERWLTAVTDSIRQNNPEILESHLKQVAAERQEEGYAIAELHAIVQITERHLHDVILHSEIIEAERNGNLALLDVVMNAARMVLSVTYVLFAQERRAS